MLSPQTIAIVKSTVPLLESAGTAITEHFYNRLFTANPELQNIFNMSNQKSGRQQFALFSAIAAYAKNIDNLAALGPMVERIANKHTSYFIQPEQYAIVGHHLIETLRELAPDAFTPEVEAAWTEAYGLLTQILTGREAQLYSDKENQNGGWKGPRKFTVHHKQRESERVTSFTLVPSDGGPVASYNPGQYLGVKIKPAHAEYTEIRQYSLSDKPNNHSYRISVKRETTPYTGLISNYLHDHISTGDEIECLPPAGDFFLHSHNQATVLISAGVGLTPMMSMLESLLEEPHHLEEQASTPTTSKNNAPIWFLHACENAEQHSFANRLTHLKQQNSRLTNHYWYSNDQPLNEFTSKGLMDLHPLANTLPLNTGHFYICGPTGFMAFIKKQLLTLGVKNECIHYEVFGPHSDL